MRFGMRLAILMHTSLEGENKTSWTAVQFLQVPSPRHCKERHRKKFYSVVGSYRSLTIQMTLDVLSRLSYVACVFDFFFLDAITCILCANGSSCGRAGRQTGRRVSCSTSAQ